MLTFLGIEIDTVQQWCRFLKQQLAKLKALVVVVLASRKVTLLEFQQLEGHINFSCNVVAPGRSFL